MFFFGRYTSCIPGAVSCIYDEDFGRGVEAGGTNRSDRASFLLRLLATLMEIEREKMKLVY